MEGDNSLGLPEDEIDVPDEHWDQYMPHNGKVPLMNTCCLLKMSNCARLKINGSSLALQHL